MDEATLRSWVRGELDKTRRREVTRWMLRCDDPRLPDVLSGLITEWEEEQADERLLARLPGLGWLTEAWERLLDAGAATFQPPVAALATLAGAGDELVLVRGDEGVYPLLTLDGAAEVAAWVTDDADGVTLLEPPRPRPAGRHALAAWRADPDDGRVRFWVAVGAGVPQDLEEALATQRVLAVRLDD